VSLDHLTFDVSRSRKMDSPTGKRSDGSLLHCWSYLLSFDCSSIRPPAAKRDVPSHIRLDFDCWLWHSALGCQSRREILRLFRHFSRTIYHPWHSPCLASNKSTSIWKTHNSDGTAIDSWKLRRDHGTICKFILRHT
jgi:hypothetical protein